MLVKVLFYISIYIYSYDIIHYIYKFMKNNITYYVIVVIILYYYQQENLSHLEV